MLSIRSVFGDAGHWIALVNPKEELHAKAVSVSRRLGRVRIVTTDLVLVETLNFYAGAGPVLRRLAVRLVEQTAQSASVEVVRQTPELFAQALALYHSRPDKDWGMANCVSFCVMHDRELTDALAYDHHFMQAGFRALLREA